MRSHFVLLLFALLVSSSVRAADTNLAPDNPIIATATPRDFPAINNKGQWQSRARIIREQILVSAGLWPMPDKTPLHSVISGKIVRDGYTIEKVYFETWPGFYLAGNLYRPLGHGAGPFPAVLSPHGHWDEGRLTDTELCSLPARCINFAKQGMIAFSYDLVGYNDTHFADSPTNQPFYKTHHDFAANNPAALLWNISLMGLQTWNSLRALDFIASLPDADPHRLGCTGESGGGTQTFMLGAIDNRLAVQAPVVMVSHVMQGGCFCENMPGLRVEYSNMEIAAAPAPRPQILVGATGDWTKTTLTVEGPALEHIYQLFQATNNLRYVEFNFPHNCNQTSREALYQWFDKILLNAPDEPVKELPYSKEPDAALRVFPDGKLPADALTEDAFIQSRIRAHAAQLAALEPHDKASLAKYKQIMQPALTHTLLLRPADTDTSFAYLAAKSDYSVQRVTVHAGEDYSRSMLRFVPTKTNAFAQPLLVIFVNTLGAKTFLDGETPAGLARELLKHNIEIAIVEDLATPPAADEHSVLFNCYNRTQLQLEIRDLMNICQAAKTLDFKNYRVVLYGAGHGAFWSLLAAQSADAVIADCGQLDISNDQNLLAPGLYCPGIRNIDTFNATTLLAAPHPLLLENISTHFPTENLRATYQLLNASEKFQINPHPLSAKRVLAWLNDLNR
ncbi:MAG TPA: acetylxylan esterase [Verrucomicrobiae bacterium]|jgi:hypothetical protein|nr:acetylxylan esterase [Verrucomicrobiae bacterium]